MAQATKSPVKQATETTEFRKNWIHIKKELKNKFPDLKDADLKYEEGKEDELYTRLQNRTGKTKNEVKKEIDQILKATSVKA